MASVAGFEQILDRLGRGGTSRRRRDSDRPAPALSLASGAGAQSLASFIEGEIIPRLMVAHSSVLRDASAPLEGAGFVSRAEIDAFAPLALALDADGLLAHVETLLARGVSVETLLVDLIAPTARHLGLLWEDDRCDFVDVTMGLWRLQEIVHELSIRCPQFRSPPQGMRHAVFTAMPGDQHGFGAFVVEQMFGRDGWETDLLLDASTADLLDRAAAGWIDLFGLTLSCTCHIERMPSLILALRSVSSNPRLCIMVGGPVFIGDPMLAVKVGADGTAADARLAVKVAGDLVDSLWRESAACG